MNWAKLETNRMRVSDWEIRRIRIQRFYIPTVMSALVLPARLILAIALILTLKLLKPFIYIRFARLLSSTMGLFTLPTEVYMCEVDEGMHPKRARDIFYHFHKPDWNRGLEKQAKPEDSVCNEQLDEMIKRRLPVHDFARPLDNLVRMFPTFGKEFSMLDQLPSPEGGERGNEYLSRQEDIKGLLDSHPAHLKFTEQEEAEGARRLEAMGITPGSPMVCFHARDAAWMPTAHPRNERVFGEMPLDERRNANIENYLPAAKALVSAGYSAVRVGKFVAEALPVDDSGIIDYSTKHQSDLMDVYLAAKCDFFIGQNSGMTGLPLIFRTPIAFVNIYPLRYINYCANEPNIFIPKNFYSEEKGRLLTFREQFDLDLARLNVVDDASLAKTVQELGLKILENSPEEISDVALEMDLRLRSEFSESEETKALREQFSSIIKSYPQSLYLDPSRYEHLRIASCFLERHPELVN